MFLSYVSMTSSRLWDILPSLSLLDRRALGLTSGSDLGGEIGGLSCVRNPAREKSDPKGN